MQKTKPRINRNIVECKDLQEDLFSLDQKSINRNIVECKETMQDNLSGQLTVLIETLWNVKGKPGADGKTPYLY